MTKLQEYKAERLRIKKVVGEDCKNPKYVIVWGYLYRSYTGTTACTGFGSVRVRTKTTAKAKMKKIQASVSDLICLIDLETGKTVEL